MTLHSCAVGEGSVLPRSAMMTWYHTITPGGVSGGVQERFTRVPAISDSVRLTGGEGVPRETERMQYDPF